MSFTAARYTFGAFVFVRLHLDLFAKRRQDPGKLGDENMRREVKPSIIIHTFKCKLTGNHPIVFSGPRVSFFHSLITF